MAFFMLTTTFPKGELDSENIGETLWSGVDAYTRAAPGEFKVVSSFRIDGSDQTITLVKARTPEACDRAVAAMQEATKTKISVQRVSRV